MIDDEIKQRFFYMWVVIAILIFASNVHSLSISEITERVDALEQSETNGGRR